MRALLGLVVAAMLACSGTSSRAPTPPQISTPPQNAMGGQEPTVTPPGASSADRVVEGNTRIRSFSAAKKELTRIYREGGAHTDLYCGCPFASGPQQGLVIDLAACGYASARDAARAERIEWEHAVPASKFGRSLPEWKDGAERCVTGEGKRFKGRKCATRASAEFARMEADMHNLFPVVGEVNGIRGDLPMGLLDSPERAASPRRHQTFRFGACQTTIAGGVFLPRPEVRGDLARAYKYMDAAYPSREILDDEHRAMFDRWSAEDPPDAWERERNARIAARQGNANPFIGTGAAAEGS
jgi:deoxyribonuclease I